MNGGMNCADLSRFTDPVHATGGNLDWQLASYSHAQVSGAPQSSTPMSNGKFAAMVSGVQGSLRGGGESIVVVQSGDAGTPSAMELANQAPATMIGYATSFGTANPGGGAANWVPIGDADFAKLTEKDLNEFPSSHTLDVHEVKLAPLDTSICFLEQISGQFDGGGESIKLLQKDDYWHLRISSGCRVLGSGGFLAQSDFCQERKTIRATARCYRLNQQ